MLTPKPTLVFLCGALFACNGATQSKGAREPDPMNEGGRDAGAANGMNDASAGDSGIDAANRDAQSPANDADSPDDNTTTKPIRHTFVYVGGWDWSSQSYPFKAFSLDRSTGKLAALGDTNLGPNPSMIAKSGDGRFLYVGNEKADATGGVTVASIQRDTGALTSIDHEAADSSDIVFTSLSPDGHYVLASSYGKGRAFVFPVGSDGKISQAVDSESFGATAQSHSIRIHPTGKWAFVPNKGLDQIAQLTFNLTSGQLTPQTDAAYESKAGSGPRHIAFDPKGTYAFVSNEKDSTLSVFAITNDGTLKFIETESTIPSTFTQTNTGAHVLVHPSGRYVYASNRGHQSIAVFKVEADGSVTLVEHEPSRGNTPRHFDVDDRGELMVVANQDSGSVAVFKIGADGTLTALGDVVTGLKEPNAVAIVNVE